MTYTRIFDNAIIIIFSGDNLFDDLTFLFGNKGE